MLENKTLFHLPTHSLLVGLIFTVIFCTTLILDKLGTVIEKLDKKI